jgi:hypothetical protein
MYIKISGVNFEKPVIEEYFLLKKCPYFKLSKIIEKVTKATDVKYCREQKKKKLIL